MLMPLAKAAAAVSVACARGYLPMEAFQRPMPAAPPFHQGGLLSDSSPMTVNKVAYFQSAVLLLLLLLLLLHGLSVNAIMSLKHESPSMVHLQDSWSAGVNRSFALLLAKPPLWNQVLPAACDHVA